MVNEENLNPGESSLVVRGEMAETVVPPLVDIGSHEPMRIETPMECMKIISPHCSFSGCVPSTSECVDDLVLRERDGVPERDFTKSGGRFSLRKCSIYCIRIPACW
jgi:hypothetical protein